MLLVHCEFSMRVWRGTNHRGQPNPWARSAPRRSRRAYALSFELSPWPACIQALDMPLRLRPPHRPSRSHHDDPSCVHLRRARRPIGMNRGPSTTENGLAQVARGALNAAPDARLTVDYVWFVRCANPRVADVFGNFREWFMVRSLDQLIPRRFRSMGTGSEEQFIETRHAHVRDTAADLIVRGGDGTEFPVAFFGNWRGGRQSSHRHS